MLMRDLVFHHLGVALTMQTLAACALGYLSHVLQQRWHAENYLLLHISVWWAVTVVLALYLVERRASRGERQQLQRQRLGDRLLPNAVFRADAVWHREATSETVTDDMPVGGPLFRSICLRMPSQWNLEQMQISIAAGIQTASFGRPGTKRFELDFGPWGGAWRISLHAAQNVNPQDAEKFLLDLQRVLDTTHGVNDVRWFGDADLEAGLSDAENAHGSRSPCAELRLHDMDI
jgi:hypothetical protein